MKRVLEGSDNRKVLSFTRFDKEVEGSYGDW